LRASTVTDDATNVRRDIVLGLFLLELLQGLA